MHARLTCIAASVVLGLLGCDRGPNQSAIRSSAARSPNLAEARQGIVTKLTRRDRVGEPVPNAPPGLFRQVEYPTPLGNLAAYVSPAPADGQKHAAIIWIVGGFANTISEIAWNPGPAENDQSASAFRDAGILMMYPSLRGGNQNPGCLEGFYGEVDDVLAAADYLAALDYVDAQRIYLGGHSTGGTLVMLVAECPNRFRAVFAFGPVADVRGYGEENLPFDLANREEAALRAPGRWLQGVAVPTFVFEGNGRRGNLGELTAMARANRNPSIHFHPVKGGDHFSILQPVSRLVAAKILQDDGPDSNLVFTEAELAGAMGKQHR
jgi:acetyl esterase/lipase